MSNALQILNALADQRKGVEDLTFPYPVEVRYSDKDANDLVRCIVDFLNLSGHLATRLESTGNHYAYLQKFIPSIQRTGMPVVLAYVNRQLVGIYVKHGKDCFSVVEKQTSNDLISVGIGIYVAYTFEGFYDWFITYVLPNPKPSVALYNQRHPISHLATPDLPEQKLKQ